MEEGPYVVFVKPKFVSSNTEETRSVAMCNQHAFRVTGGTRCIDYVSEVAGGCLRITVLRRISAYHFPVRLKIYPPAGVTGNRIFQAALAKQDTHLRVCNHE